MTGYCATKFTLEFGGRDETVFVVQGFLPKVSLTYCSVVGLKSMVFVSVMLADFLDFSQRWLSLCKVKLELFFFHISSISRLPPTLFNGYSTGTYSAQMYWSILHIHEEEILSCVVSTTPTDDDSSVPLREHSRPPHRQQWLLYGVVYKLFDDQLVVGKVQLSTSYKRNHHSSKYRWS